MKIAIEGCCHGELDKIYETIAYLERTNNVKIDILLICGDFQSVRNPSDLQCMAVPAKYRVMNTFYKYYSGEKKAPILTLFIGGNHEASNYLQELPYGGWVAPNIYYMGYANVVQFGGVRIGGLSGIYKPHDYDRGHFERPPYSEDTKRSAYHIRNVDVFRLKQLSRPVDIMMSHDWPRGVYNHGNKKRLIRAKRHFKDEVESDTLGSVPARVLLHHLKPTYWFSAHLHVKFAAAVQHQMDDGTTKTTKFLSLDKCLPKRQFLQVIDVPHDAARPLTLQLDPEWLVILKSTNHLLNVRPNKHFMPGLGSSERWDYRVSDQEMESMKSDFDGNLNIPDNFEKTAPAYIPGTKTSGAPPPTLQTNPQTTLLCTMLELTDPNAEFLGRDSSYKLDTSSLSDSFRDDGIHSDNDDSVCSSVNTTYSSSFNATMDSSFNPDEIPIDDDDLITGELTSESDVPPTTASSADEKDSESQSACSDDVGCKNLEDNDDDADELMAILDAQKRGANPEERLLASTGEFLGDTAEEKCLNSPITDKNSQISHKGEICEHETNLEGKETDAESRKNEKLAEITAVKNDGHTRSLVTSEVEESRTGFSSKLGSSPLLEGLGKTGDVSPKRGLPEDRDDKPAMLQRVKKMKRRNMCVYSSEDTEGEG